MDKHVEGCGIMLLGQIIVQSVVYNHWYAKIGESTQFRN